jgi:hypothetical protein
MNTPEFEISSKPELADWVAYFNQLASGQLDKFAGRFIVMFQGKVVASGEDPEELRLHMAQQLNVEPGGLVIPFVEPKESIIAD